MKTVATCPNCGTSYRVSTDSLGRAAKCRRCGDQLCLQASELQTGLAGDTTDTAKSPRVRSERRLPKRLGRFDIKEHLGEGGFGQVFRAWDPTLEREVALKVPHADKLADQQLRQRYLQEPKAAAKLQHPNIVPVFDANLDGDNLFIASAFVEGRTLQKYAAGRTLDFVESARLVRKLAEALNYAHSQGIVHCDVKPDNIMLNSDGEPMLMDFGLARMQAAASHPGEKEPALGTPAYMSPEQAAAKHEELGAASDQYSVGVVLYELLCSELPFNGPRDLIVSLIQSQEPPPPTTHNSQIPRDLEAICLKAMAKAPEGRYKNCQAMADDLHRWLDKEPVKARPIGPAERLRRWCQRNPVTSGLTAALLVFGMAGFITVTWLWRDAVQARITAELAEAQAVEARDRERAAARQEALAREQAAIAAQEAQRQERIAQQESAAAESALARASTAETASQQFKADATAAKFSAAQRQAERLLSHSLMLSGQDKPVEGLLWLARSLKMCPEQEADLEARIRSQIDLKQRHLHQLVNQRPVASSYNWSNPDSVRLQLVASGETVVCGTSTYPTRYGELLQDDARVALRISTSAQILAISPDGRLAAVEPQARLDRDALWFLDMATGQATEKSLQLAQMGQTSKRFDRIKYAAFGHSTRKLTTVSSSGNLSSWNLKTHQRISGPYPTSGRFDNEAPPELTLVAFSPDGSRIAITSNRYLAERGLNRKETPVGGKSLIYSTLTGETEGEAIHHEGMVCRVCFSADGQKLLVGEHGFSSRSAENSEGPVVHYYPRMNSGARYRRIPVRKSLGVEGYSRLTVRNARTGATMGEPLIIQGRLYDAVFVVNDRIILTATNTGKRSTIVTPANDQKRTTTAAINIDETVKHNAAVSEIRVWDAASKTQIGQTLRIPGECAPVAVSADGRTLATLRGVARRYWLDGPNEELSSVPAPQRGDLNGLDGPEDLIGRRGSLDSGRIDRSGLILGDPQVMQGQVLQVWELRISYASMLNRADRATSVLTFPTPYPGFERFTADTITRQRASGSYQHRYILTFSRDGQSLAVGGPLTGKATVTVFDVKSGKKRLQVNEGGKYAYGVSFSRDGKRIATADAIGLGKLWDTETGQELVTFSNDASARKWNRSGRSGVASIDFSPDGQTLASVWSDRSIKLWSASSGQQHLSLKGHRAVTSCVRFSPDGRSLASASDDKTIKLWDCTTGAEIQTFVGHIDRINSVAFSPDGQRIASAANDNLVLLWNLATSAKRLTLNGHSDWVNCVAFSPDGRRCASGGDDKSIRVWDTITGTELLLLKGHTGSVRSLIFVSNSHLASAGDDQTVKYWNLSGTQFNASIDGTPDQVQRWTEAITGMELGADDSLRLLDAEIWQSRRREADALIIDRDHTETVADEQLLQQ